MPIGAGTPPRTKAPSRRPGRDLGLEDAGAEPTQETDTPSELAAKYGVSVEAIEALRDALRCGGGRQAQFSHPDLGGMGQWSAGGMTQVGDMFNTALKDKVNAL